VTKRRAVVPANGDPLATRLVRTPLDQLAQDPARLFLQRALDLRKRNPARRGHAQVAVVDHEADRAPARAPQLVVHRLRAQQRRAQARRHPRRRRRRGGRRQVEQRQGQLQRSVGDGLDWRPALAGAAACVMTVERTCQAIGSFVAPGAASRYRCGLSRRISDSIQPSTSWLNCSALLPSLAIVGPIDTVITPGRRTNFRRGQNSPEFTAIGTTGTPVRTASRAPPVLYLPCAPARVRVPSGKMMIHRPSASLRVPWRTTCSNASLPRLRSMWIMPSNAMPQPKNGMNSSSRLNT